MVVHAFASAIDIVTLKQAENCGKYLKSKKRKKKTYLQQKLSLDTEKAQKT